MTGERIDGDAFFFREGLEVGRGKSINSKVSPARVSRPVRRSTVVPG